MLKRKRGTSGRWPYIQQWPISHSSLTQHSIQPIKPSFCLLQILHFLTTARESRETTGTVGKFRRQQGDSHGWVRGHFSWRRVWAVFIVVAASSPESFLTEEVIMPALTLPC